MLKSPDIQNFKGLSETEAGRILKAYGYNELPLAGRKGPLMVAFGVLREPMFLLLLTGGLLYLFLGDVKEASMLLCFVCLIMGITIYQESKTEKALDTLRDLSSPRALIIRDGVVIRVAGREVVRDDIIVIAEGDRVPADAEILTALNLYIDESLLTGESVPVHKIPGGDESRAYSGTMVIKGQGIARVYATGSRTELGKIGTSLKSIEREPTALEKETLNLIRNVAVIGIMICVLLVIIYGLTRSSSDDPLRSWLDGLLAGIALAMALLPEEFPVILTVFMAIGAWRMSKKNVLTRKSSAIESLGAATVLCVDKTGTITWNQMTVSRIFSGGSVFSPSFHDQSGVLPENFHRLVEYSILASQESPFDPMEKAIKQLGEYKLRNTEHIHEDWELVQEYPLGEELMAMSNVWRMPGGYFYMIAAKGSPEAILDLCHVDDNKRKDIMKNVMEFAADGLRVLGVAHSEFHSEVLPDIQHDFDFEFLGLIGLSDPVRRSVSPAVKECYGAGIRIMMMTGDYPGTAINVGRQIGLRGAGNPIIGQEIVSMNKNEFKKRLRNAGIFARVAPEQKLTIVNLMKEMGEVVAMTGDGVNDAPALKASNIGIAMGLRGTDVAREASDLVLLDDDFSSIVSAVRMGRKIFDNLKKAMIYVISIHIPIAGMALIPVLFNSSLILMPVHIVFLELIIDPACSIVFEAEREEAGIMDRPPRNLNDPLIGRTEIIMSLFQGLCVLLTSLAIYQLSGFRISDPRYSRAAAFTTLIIANLGLILSGRSWKLNIISALKMKNTALWLVVCGSIILLSLVLFLPALRDLFLFDKLKTYDIILCIGAGLVNMLLFDILKFLFLKR